MITTIINYTTKILWRFAEGGLIAPGIVLWFQNIFPDLDIPFLEQMNETSQAVLQIISILYAVIVFWHRIRMNKTKRARELEALEKDRIENKILNQNLKNI